MTTNANAERLLCAIDTVDLDAAVTTAASLQGLVGGIKLGLEFFTAHGPAGVNAVSAASAVSSAVAAAASASAATWAASASAAALASASNLAASAWAFAMLSSSLTRTGGHSFATNSLTASLSA